MRPRIIQLRGLPGMLMLGVFAVVAIGLLALVLVVGAAVAVAGLAISAGVALFYTLRRTLSAGAQPAPWLKKTEKPDTASTSLVVRDIEVEVLPQKER